MPRQADIPSYERLVGPLTSAVVAPFSRSIENLVSGMKERVYFIDDAGTRRPACLRSLFDVRGLLDEVVSAVGSCHRETCSEYISHKTGAKRKIYEAAAVRLATGGGTIRKLAELSYFVKSEGTMWSKVQVPRVISPRGPEFNLMLGRYMHPLEPKIFSALQEVVGSGSPVVAKGLTQEAKAEIIVEKLTQWGMCIGLDASRFDQCIQKPLLQLEHYIYNKVYTGDRLLPELLRAQLDNVGVGRAKDGQVRADIGAMRCSGDVNTSLGNCLISVVLALAYLRENGIKGDIFCDGDDLLLFCHPSVLSSLSTLTAWYLRWGLRMKVEPPAYLPEQVEFCQSRIVNRGGEWVLCRNFAKALNTDGFSPVPLTPSQRLCHIRAVGLCGLSMAAGMPVLQPYYAALVRDGKTGKVDYDRLGGIGYQWRLQTAAGHMASARPITAEARLSFWEAFGVSPSDQVAWEEALTTVNWSRRVDSENLSALSTLIPIKDALTNSDKNYKYG